MTPFPALDFLRGSITMTVIGNNLNNASLLASSVELETPISAETGGPVTPAEFFGVFLEDDAQAKQKLAGWIENGQIGDDVLGASYTLNNYPLAVYLAQNDKPALKEEIFALIDILPKSALESVDPRTGETAMIRAAKVGNGLVLWKLAEAGADPNAVDQNKCNALMAAVKEGQASPELVRYLCRNGLHLDAVDDTGRTVLHHAAASYVPEVIAPLIAAGANTTILDREGKTPTDLSAAVDEQDEGGDKQTMGSLLRTSRVDMLAYIGSIFGDAFRADLLKASTAAWQAVADTMEYALGIHVETVSSAFLDSQRAPADSNVDNDK